MDGPQSSVLVLRVSKKFAKPLSDHIRKNFWEDKTYRISPAKDSEDLLIPILPSSSEATKAVLPQLLGDNFQQDHPYILSVDSSLLIPSKSQPRAPGIEHIRHILTSEFSWPTEHALQIPDKWIKYGDCIVLETDTLPAGDPEQALKAFQQSGICSDVRCILIHSGPVEGELRKPKVDLYTTQQSPETLHIENTIKFKFNVTKIMFAPGNGTERMRIANLKLESKDELVIDMFAGLGYFTLPLAKFHPDNIGKIIALEKNPDSHGYLCQNVVLNKLQNKVFPLHGDNRIIAQEYVGKADRILMGYLPNTKDFIERALQFAKPNKSVIFHYHHLCQKSEFNTLALSDFQSCMDQLGVQRQAKIITFFKVKSYAPKIFHCCADLELSPLPENQNP